MPGFRRAQLRGSDELFRPTTQAGDRQDRTERAPLRDEEPYQAARTAAPPGRLLRLSDDEIQVLAEALQRLKFPGQGKLVTKPSVDEFERLEELRQKLLSAG